LNHYLNDEEQGIHESLISLPLHQTSTELENLINLFIPEINNVTNRPQPSTQASCEFNTSNLLSDVYNDPLPYIHHLENYPTPLDIELLWNTIRANYGYSGQYADNDLMMSTVTALNFDIQIHGESNHLLILENRIDAHSIHLLYSGTPTYGNRGIHYDALIPIIHNSNNLNNHIGHTILSNVPQSIETYSPSKDFTNVIRSAPIRSSDRLRRPNKRSSISSSRHPTRTNYDHTRQFIVNRLRLQNRTAILMALDSSYLIPQLSQLNEALKQSASGYIPVIPLVEKKGLITVMNRFASNQFKYILEQCYICKEDYRY